MDHPMNVLFELQLKRLKSNNIYSWLKFLSSLNYYHECNLSWTADDIRQEVIILLIKQSKKKSACIRKGLIRRIFNFKAQDVQRRENRRLQIRKQKAQQLKQMINCDDHAWISSSTFRISMNPVDLIEIEEKNVILRRCLAQLNEFDRRLATSVLTGMMTSVAFAQHVGMTPACIKSRIRRLRVRIKKLKVRYSISQYK